MNCDRSLARAVRRSIDPLAIICENFDEHRSDILRFRLIEIPVIDDENLQLCDDEVDPYCHAAYHKT